MDPLSGVLRPHISLDVTNVAASTQFYTALFGTLPIKVKTDYAKFELQHPPLNFSINQRSSLITPDAGKLPGGMLNHLGFQVSSTEDVLQAKTRLEASGLVSFDEMDVTCCYAKQDKIWVHDPDGTPWEIFVVTEASVEYRDDRPSATSTANCCVPSAHAVGGLATANSQIEITQPACC